MQSVHLSLVQQAHGSKLECQVVFFAVQAHILPQTHLYAYHVQMERTEILQALQHLPVVDLAQAALYLERLIHHH